MTDDWGDPFADDPSAREREARRAEREARRRARQESLAGKVADQRGAGAPPAPQATSERPAAAPAAAEPGPDGAGARGATRVDGARPTQAERIAHLRARTRGAFGGSTPSHRQIVYRRLFGAGLLIALLALIAFGVSAVLDQLGDDDPAPAPAKAVKVEDVVIPEGLDYRQIADVAKEAGVEGDYAKAAKQPPRGFDPGKYGAGDPPSLEGFLFPATYELEKDAAAEDLVAKQIEAFEENMRGVDLTYAESKNLTAYDVLIIASMIEREVQVEKERPLVSAVIYNRLAAGDMLGIDATIRYYLQNYDEQLTESELADPHPYNTRVNPGLPPTPISNPGLASIEAAAKPAKSDAYYFVVKPGTCGEHVFAETEEEFAAAEAEYQAALQAEGGSPTDCG
jgi:UPF0755 protein